VAGEEHDYGDGGAGCGYRLGPSASTQLASQQAGQQHGEAGRDGRRQPQHQQRIRCYLAHGASDQWSDRALVRIAPVEVLAGREEIELVAVVPVAGGESDEHCRHRSGGDKHEPVHAQDRTVGTRGASVASTTRSGDWPVG
jgi:hypothetical protein